VKSGGRFSRGASPGFTLGSVARDRSAVCIQGARRETRRGVLDSTSSTFSKRRAVGMRRRGTAAGSKG